jgi:hypothetical protein
MPVAAMTPVTQQELADRCRTQQHPSHHQELDMTRSTTSRAALAGAGALALTVLALPSAASSAAPTRFAGPVKVTPANGGGYEPTIVTDRFGNLYATAHKENAELALSPDGRSATQTRSQSWAWLSTDKGKSWKNLPGLPADAENRQFGDEGDMAVDDAGHTYFIDTYLADNTITRYTATGQGKVAFDFTNPAIATGGLDDRPWVTAHGDGKVFYLGNQGDKSTYEGKAGDGDAYGPGRYTVYPSYDGGQSFDTLGFTLNDSGWCRPAAEHKAGSKRVIVFCGNDNGKLYSYVSNDDAKSFKRYLAGTYNGNDSTQSYPTVEFAKDGSIWALYVDADELKSGMPVTNRLRLMHSVDGGKTWREQDITQKTGRYQYGWLSVSPDGKQLGLGVYHRPNLTSPWKVYGATWKPGQVPTLVALDSTPVAPADYPEAPGDFLTSSFGPDNKLAVIWTRVVVVNPAKAGVQSLYRDIYSARQR